MARKTRKKQRKRRKNPEEDNDRLWTILGIAGAVGVGILSWRYLKRKSLEQQYAALPGPTGGSSIHQSVEAFKRVHGPAPQVAMGSWPQQQYRNEGGIPTVPLPAESAQRTMQAWPSRYGPQAQQKVEVQLPTPQGRPDMSGMNGAGNGASSRMTPPPVERFGGEGNGLGGETF